MMLGKSLLRPEHSNFGVLVSALRDGKIDEAKPHFKTYLQLEPDAKDAATIRSFLQGG